jgi:hypothetical protein
VAFCSKIGHKEGYYRAVQPSLKLTLRLESTLLRPTVIGSTWMFVEVQLVEFDRDF